MSRFRPIDRRTEYLRPPLVQEWLLESHLARYVVDVVEGLELRVAAGMSDFLWAIPWEFSVAGGARTRFAGGFTANHYMTSSFFCAASIEKMVALSDQPAVSATRRDAAGRALPSSVLPVGGPRGAVGGGARGQLRRNSSRFADRRHTTTTAPSGLARPGRWIVDREGGGLHARCALVIRARCQRAGEPVVGAHDVRAAGVRLCGERAHTGVTGASRGGAVPRPSANGVQVFPD